jgi:polyisoprenoid-binding protein YceI
MKKPLVIVGGIAGVVVLAAVALVAIQLLRSDDPNLATEAPQLATTTAGTSGAAGSPGATAEATSGSGDADPPTGARHFVIDPAQSEAKYVVRESLRGLKTNAVGTTKAVEGDVYLTSEGLSDATESSFRVDLSTLKSDENMRDNYIKRNTLQTDQFQYATFTIDNVTGFPADYVEDTEVEMTLSGTLTIRDVSKPVTWAVKARQAGDALSAVADLTIKFKDFGMSPPNVTIAQAEDDIQLQVVPVAQEA